jgi:hypothetical protein
MPNILPTKNIMQLLLGQTPLRRLSQSLIIILMLISPLSFSTEQITNFTYECPVSTICAVKQTRRSAIHNHAGAARQPDCHNREAHLAASSPLYPPPTRFITSALSRAPPALT